MDALKRQSKRFGRISKLSIKALEITEQPNNRRAGFSS